jgi:pilus assembly protein Flp/PilA
MKRKNRKLGQGMTEYLIMVAIIGIAAIAVTRGVSKNMKVGFGKISNALRGVEQQVGTYHTVTEEEVRGRSMNDFNTGVQNRGGTGN